MLGSLLPGWLRGPLQLQASLDDGPHTLGDEVFVSVEVRSRRDVMVTAGRVDLVCNERWAETWIKPEPMGRAAGMLRRGAELPGPTAPKREVKEVKNSFVHSSATFAEGLRVRPGTPQRLRISLRIDKEWPPHAKGGTLTWDLAVVLKPSRGREANVIQEIDVTVP